MSSGIKVVVSVESESGSHLALHLASCAAAPPPRGCTDASLIQVRDDYHLKNLAEDIPLNSYPRPSCLILHPRDYCRWLGIDDKGGDPRPPLDLLHPYDADKMVMKPANPAVGNWRNNGPEMLDRT